MSDAILTINAGSSSVKMALFDANSIDGIMKGQVSGIGSDTKLKLKDSDGATILEQALPNEEIRTPSDAIRLAIAEMEQRAGHREIHAVGHRIVHGGVRHEGPLLLDDNEIAELEQNQNNFT